MVILKIINMDQDVVIVPDDINGKEYFGINGIKLAKFTEIRTIGIAPDLSEVYGEAFDIYYKNGSGTSYVFDYNILYGDFSTEPGDVYTSDFYKYESAYDKRNPEKTLEGMYFKSFTSESKSLLGEMLNDDVYCMVCGGIFETPDSNLNYKVIESMWDEFIPSATLKYHSKRTIPDMVKYLDGEE